MIAGGGIAALSSAFFTASTAALTFFFFFLSMADDQHSLNSVLTSRHRGPNALIDLPALLEVLAILESVPLPCELLDIHVRHALVARRDAQTAFERLELGLLLRCCLRSKRVGRVDQIRLPKISGVKRLLADSPLCLLQRAQSPP